MRQIIYIYFKFLFILLFATAANADELSDYLVVPEYPPETEHAVNDINTKKDNPQKPTLNNLIKYRFDEPNIEFKPASAKSESQNNISLSSQPFDIKIFKNKNYMENGFYKIQVTYEKNKLSKEMNVNAIFFIDSSASVAGIQLTEIRSGIEKALKQMQNTGVNFNIFDVKNKTKQLFKTCQSVNPTNRKRANAFLDKIINTGHANIAGQLSSFINSQTEPQKRKNILFFITDGKVNTQIPEDKMRIIKSITDHNKAKFTILPISNSSHSGSLFMELIAKSSNGTYLQTKQTINSSASIENFILTSIASEYESISYRIPGDLGCYTYPRNIPNSFSNNKIEIYGFYKEGQNKLDMKLSLININNITTEYYFTKDISEAEITKEDLRKEWGKQFILHQYTKLMKNYSPHLYKEIVQESHKFNVRF